jgi:sugar lactone lactonase YvrE
MFPKYKHRFLAFLLLGISTALGLQAQSNYATPYTFNTLAGINSPNPSSVEGTRSAARFKKPTGVAVDANGVLYIADTENHTIRKITTTGVVTTLAGNAGTAGSTDGTDNAARFNNPFAVAVDSAGNVYVADYGNDTVRKITSAGVVTTLAGTANSPGSVNATGSAARFNCPSGIAVDANGNVYVADYGNHTIRKITSAGAVTTLAGTANSPGSTDGTGGAARFKNPNGVAVDTSGNIYVADMSNHVIRKITKAGVVTTLAGTAASLGSANGTGTEARFNYPTGVSVDRSGNVFVADWNNSTVRKINLEGLVTTLAGTVASIGSADGTGSAARFYKPSGVAADGFGNVFIADAQNSTVRKINSRGVVTTLAGTAGAVAAKDGIGGAARFNTPSGVALDSAGNVYVADAHNSTIRKVASSGEVTTLAGAAGSVGSADGTSSTARFNYPIGVALDSSGNLYVADREAHTIRKISSAGVVTTLAGKAGSLGIVDGTGSAARFNYPSGVAVDNNGNVYVADKDNHTIRKITSSGVVTTLAGLACAPDAADRTRSAARFNKPSGVAVDGNGNLYVADTGNQTIRKITSNGVVTTLAGTAGSRGSTDGTGSAARFDGPTSIAVDARGDVYVADANNKTIRKITSGGVVTTLAGAVGSTNATDGTGSAAHFNRPVAVAVTPSGQLVVADDKIATAAPYLSNAANTAFVNALAAAGVPTNQRSIYDDPDLDGIPNLMEYALGLAPMTPNRTGLPAAQVSGSNLTLTYKHAVNDVTYTVLTTTDIAGANSWTATGVNQGNPDANGTTTASIPYSGGTRFLRLQTTLTP